ncbi:MAG: ABC transporter substrate-binding protein [Candidatus Rokuibacteriota bacterium]
MIRSSHRPPTVLLASTLAVALLGAALVASAQSDIRTPLPAPLKVKQGMANVPALSPLYLLPDEAKKYNIQIEQVMFQRFADLRTALASGDLDIGPFGPQDISLAASQGVKSLVGVAGVGSGNDCLIVRKGEDFKAWPELLGKGIGVGAGSISWLKFTASVTENGVDYRKLKIVNIMGGGASYLKALQAKEIDMAVVWQPFCAQAITEGWGAYPTLDHNQSKTVGGQLGVFAVNRAFLDKHPAAVQRIVVAYLDTLELARGDMTKWAEIYAQKAGLPVPVARESIRITKLDSTLPLATIKRMTKFLAEIGIVQKDVSGEIAQYYTYDFLARATGKTPAELGLNR